MSTIRFEAEKVRDLIQDSMKGMQEFVDNIEENVSHQCHTNKTQSYLTVTKTETMTALRILNTKVLFTYVACTNISAKVSNWYSVIIANFASNYKKVP